MELLGTYFSEIWVITNELAPYLLLGLLFAGGLNTYVKRSFIKNHLGGTSFSSVFKAAVLGVPLPLCSCGVIPTGISFKQQGAGKGATVSFLISTPQTGIDSILISYSMLNLPWAIFRPIVALVSGIAGGWLLNLGEDKHSNDLVTPPVSKSVEQKTFYTSFVKYAFVDFLSDISRSLIGGILLAGCITLMIPDQFFQQYLNYPNLNMIIVLLASIPLYVCATGSVPIGAALLAKGLSPGAVLVFLMAGPATNAATITVLWNALGKKTTILYVGIISGFALLFGFLMNTFLPTEWFTLFSPLSTVHHHHENISILSFASSILLIAAILNVEFRKLNNRFFTKKTIQMTDSTIYKVEGMTCNHCKANVERVVGNLENSTEATVSLEQATVTVKGNVSEAEVKTSIEAAGYQFKGKL